MRFFILSLFVLFTAGCTTHYDNQLVTGKSFPSVTGQSLAQNSVNIPNDFNDAFTLLLVGYKQNSQFDIDRWLIGLDMTETQVTIYEIPTIQGMFPRMISSTINNGMRKGIPEPLWNDVITVYEGGETVQAFTGNENPNNARVLLINKQGTILYFYDRGFLVSALNTLRQTLASAE